MGEILNQGRGDSIKPVIMGLCSDTKPKSSLPVHEVKKADFGPENGEKQKQVQCEWYLYGYLLSYPKLYKKPWFAQVT